MEGFGVVIVLVLVGLFITTAECLECYHCLHADLFNSTTTTVNKNAAVLPVGKACERGRDMPEEWIKECPPGHRWATPVCATLKGMWRKRFGEPAKLLTVRGCFLKEKIRDTTVGDKLKCTIGHVFATNFMEYLQAPVDIYGGAGRQQMCYCQDKDNCNVANPQALKCYDCIYAEGKLPSDFAGMNFGESCKTGVDMPEEWTTECRMRMSSWSGAIIPLCDTSMINTENIGNVWTRGCGDNEKLDRDFILIDDKTNKCIGSIRPGTHPILGLFNTVNKCTCDRNNCNKEDATCYGRTSLVDAINGPSFDKGTTHGPSGDKGTTSGPTVTCSGALGVIPQTTIVPFLMFTILSFQQFLSIQA